MAINPNTDFTAGAILTAAQQNRFGRGIMAIGENTGSSGTVAIETVSCTSSAFTAVANRYYKITYFEPVLQYVSGTVTNAVCRIRLTNLTGAVQVFTELSVVNTFGKNQTGIVTTVKTLTAGSTVVVGTFAPTGGGSINCYRDGQAKAQIIVEDVGPA
jgi:hypothetical protein